MSIETPTKTGKKPLKGRHNTQVILTKDLLDWLDEEAERTTSSRSNIVRQAVMQFRRTRQNQEAKAA